MSNVQLAFNIFQSLQSCGVEEVCLCPGGRNAPFVKVLEQTSLFKVHSGFDERATGFFALGRSRATKLPVAVITTSGTAAAELLPSVIEAFYSQVPLILITADRPKVLRGTGAPQVIDQSALFQNYVEKFLDIEERWEKSLSTWSRYQPLHINVCFDEPLTEGEVPKASEPHVYRKPDFPLMKWQNQKMMAVSLRDVMGDFKNFMAPLKKPLLLVSDVGEGDEEAIKSFILKWPGYIYFENTSGYRHMNHSNKLISGETYLCQLLKNGDIDGVLRLGSVPTTRLWRDIETTPGPVLSLSNRPFPGLSKGLFFWLENKLLAELAMGLSQGKISLDETVLKRDRELREQINQFVEKSPLSEPAWVRWLSQQISKEDLVYVGNSLPIREWDLFADLKSTHKVLANRGANGIDGQLATALGYLSKEKTVWVLLGDLTALYDTNALWFWKKQSDCPLKLIVINNSGGKIFERLFGSELFYNQHQLNFKALAEQWGLSYHVGDKEKSLPKESSYLFEIKPNESQTKDLWQNYDGVFK